MLTPCQRRYQRVINRPNPWAHLYAPRCKEDGSFENIQCVGPQCWCVDHFGNKIPRTRTAKTLRCPTLGKEKYIFLPQMVVDLKVLTISLYQRTHSHSSSLSISFITTLFFSFFLITLYFVIAMCLKEYIFKF